MYTFIVNPHSRSGLGKQIWKSVETELDTRGICYRVFFTLPHRHIEKLIRELTSDKKEHTIIILGGDGTVNEVINGISYPEKVTLGYIPMGSGNDFARSYCLPTDPIHALNMILSAKHTEKMDIGELTYKNKNHRFAISAGFGFDAAICHEVIVSHWKSRLNRFKLGKLVYVFVALRQWFHLKPCKVNLTLDNNVTHTFQHCYFIASMNQPYEGGGFLFAPGANPSDGKLNVCVIADLSKWKMLLLLPTALWGKHIHFKGCNLYSCHSLSIHSESPRELHTDGEPWFLQTDLSIHCLPEQIHLITPQDCK